jgi:serine/threonine protein phosphatase 1
MADQPVEMLRWESLRDGIPDPHRKCIDTYCDGGGWLTALDVNTGEVWHANERGEVRRW